MGSPWVHGNTLISGKVVEVRELFNVARGRPKQSADWEAKASFGSCEVICSRQPSQKLAEQAVCDAVWLIYEATKDAVEIVQQAPEPNFVPPHMVNGYAVPDWILTIAKDQPSRAVVLIGGDDRCPEWFVKRFEAGEVPMDDPPGLEERAYMLWKACGGEVKEAKPVTMDDL